jgi:hypothetical protein
MQGDLGLFMSNELLVNAVIIALIIATYFVLRGRGGDPKFEKLYHEIVNSDKYKVKGQYEKYN